MTSKAEAAAAEEAALLKSRSAAAFRRGMIRWTLLYWAAVFLMFTLRSISDPHPHLMVQAGLRATMMAIGIGLCAGLFVFFERVLEPDWRRNVLKIAGAAALADIIYILTNYCVFYVIPGLWEPEHGPIAKLGEYVAAIFWVFPLWSLLYLVLRRQRMREDARADPPAECLWVKNGSILQRVEWSAITWLESEGDYVRINAADSSHLLRSTMARMDATLDAQRFLRIHRRFIVAKPLMERVIRLDDGRAKVLLSTGDELPVGRAYLDRVKQLTTRGAAAGR